MALLLLLIRWKCKIESLIGSISTALSRLVCVASGEERGSFPDQLLIEPKSLIDYSTWPTEVSANELIFRLIFTLYGRTTLGLLYLNQRMLEMEAP